MDGISFTPAQRKAFEWLWPDGAWRVATSKHKIGKAMNSLKLGHSSFVDCEWGQFGPQRGWAMRCRLTDIGIKARANHA